MQVVEKNIDELKPWERNPRINDHAVEAVAKSIETFGFNVPILCDQNMTIIAGHTRHKAALKIGLEKVPVIMLEMNDTQRKAFAIADNKVGKIAVWDNCKLKETIVELLSEELDLKSLGFSEQEVRNLLFTSEVDENDIPNRQSNSVVKKGQIWKLGNHRLLCGNSCNPDEINLLLGKSKIDHVFGGPPYFNLRQYIQWNSFEDYLVDIRKVIGNVFQHICDGSIVTWNIGNLSSQHLDLTSHHSLIFDKAGYKYIDTIIWLKSGANFTVMRNAHIAKNGIYYPTFQWEALLVFQKPGNMPRMSSEGKKYMSEFQSNVWEIPSVRNREREFGHPDVCPVEIPYRSIQAYTDENATIFEPFGGSGTTLIAAEKAGRQSFIMERNPQYCDIIIRRWEDFTGKKAILE